MNDILTRLEAASGTDDRTWFILREPGCVPERKGPFRPRMVKEFLIELMKHRPNEFITVLTMCADGPCVQDGPECLEMLDGRYRHMAARHRASTSRALQARGVREG